MFIHKFGKKSLHWLAMVLITGYAKTWNAYRGFKSQKEFSKAWSNGRTWMHIAEGQTILVQTDIKARGNKLPNISGFTLRLDVINSQIIVTKLDVAKTNLVTCNSFFLSEYSMGIILNYRIDSKLIRMFVHCFSVWVWIFCSHVSNHC